jgi:predicted transcriptional regulator
MYIEGLQDPKKVGEIMAFVDSLEHQAASSKFGPEVWAEIKQGEAEIEAGLVHTWEEVEAAMRKGIALGAANRKG